MISPIHINSVSAAYQAQQAPARQPPEAQTPTDYPKDTFTSSRASDLDHDGNNH